MSRRMGAADSSRRDFLKRVGRTVIASSAAGVSLTGCSGIFVDSSSLMESLRNGQYNEPVKNWDPVFGPPVQWFSRYKGPGDFQGHLRGGAIPGVDYDTPRRTPLVPPMMSYLRQIDVDRNGSLYVLFHYAFDPSYRISFGHLEEVLVDKQYVVSGEIMRFLERPLRALGRDEIVTLSGNSGKGPKEYESLQPPHLHLSLYYWDGGKRNLENLDPEKYGLDGGKPVFWDGETVLDVRPGRRIVLLENTLSLLHTELEGWPETPELRELKGVLNEYHRLVDGRKGQAILDSKHFHDMRSLLKRVVLDEKKYLPGTGPYRLMLRTVGYSTEEKQKIILTLPFISPGLSGRYRKSAYEQGPFLMLRSVVD
jgi:hypothetical protein